MSYYKLVRMPADGKAVRGRLYLCTGNGETAICETMENAEYLIPALIYRVGVTMSPRFKRLLPVLQQVPGRTGIRVHRGCRPEHSKGCILVSAENEHKLTALWLKEQNEHEESRIEIQ